MEFMLRLFIEKDFESAGRKRKKKQKKNRKHQNMIYVEYINKRWNIL